MGNIQSFNDKYKNMVHNLAIEFESIYCKREINAYMQYGVYKNALTIFILDRLKQYNYDNSHVISVINQYKPYNIEWILPDLLKGICLKKIPDKTYYEKKKICTTDTLDRHFNRILSLI